jgi:hypothetical protein
VEDEEEARRREKKFMAWVTPYIEDYEKNWEGVPERKLMDMWERFKKFDVENASNSDLWLHIEECFNSFYRMWYYHIKWIYISWCPYILLESVCKQFAGIDDSDPTFLKLVTGFDNKAFQVDRRMWQLGRRAVEIGLRETFLQSERKPPIPEINGSLNSVNFLMMTGGDLSARMILPARPGLRIRLRPYKL